MNIRNLQEYITKLCGQETLHLLGTNRELLLQKIYGQDPSKDQVKSVISDAASFASNAEEQLFYEFVQNAYDASANSLLFYANKEYLIVLNNGEPFYTDFDIFDEDSKIRDGQLYNFLAKGKSLKRNDSKKLGKYGQGSKLLYTLLMKVDDKEENEDLLIQTIYDEKKGPYLISWNDRNQLANLLLKQNNWNLAQGDDYKNNILFAKILMTYYPIAPGIDQKLFSDEEAIDAINAFDTLVDPRRNLHFLDRGTAIIIPLGEGKYERINSTENLERVKTRLGGFASITKDQNRNEGKSVEHIYVMGEEIEQHDVRSVYVEYDLEGKPFHYHFAFNPVFADKNFVNLFKGLPILETKLRLGFIIDSQKFDVDNSRQRINDKPKTESQLKTAFEKLVEELKTLLKSDRDKFDFIYKSLIASKPLDGDDFSYIRNSFREVFKPFLEEHILTENGTYENKDSVRYFECAEFIPLDKIGINNIKWIDKDSKAHLHRHDVDVEIVDLPYILENADKEKLDTWLKTLPIAKYNKFIDFVDKNKFDGKVAQYKLFRTNKGNLYSFIELKSNYNIYYPCESGMKFGDCEHTEFVLTGVDTNIYIAQLFDKIKFNIEELRSNESTVEDVANLLDWILSKDGNYFPKVRQNIALLKNHHDQYAPFKDLFIDRPNGTILFDNYMVKGIIPQAVAARKLLLSPATQKSSCWSWIVQHWQNLLEKENWGENTHKYLNDIQKVFKSVPVDENNVAPQQPKLTLYLNSDGKPTTELRTIVNNVSRLSEEEYNILDSKIDTLHLQPYEYLKALQDGPFKLETIQSSKIVDNGLRVDAQLLRILIKITDFYLSNYRTQENNGVYYITRKTGGFNYVDSVSSDLQQELANGGFYRIPNLVQEILNTEKSKYIFASNEDMLVKAINTIAHPEKLLQFVKEANANVINVFFDNINIINIDRKIEKTALEWQIIEFATQRNLPTNNYVDIVFGKIRHNGKKLPESIVSQFVNIGENPFDIYKLDSDYEEGNKTIDSFFKCLPSTFEVDYFKSHFYGEKEEKVSPENLYKELYNKYLTIEQLRFCIAYSIANEESYNELELQEDKKLEDALQMIMENKFRGFDKYFKMKDVDLDTQIYAPKELLVESEKLPNHFHQWISKHDEILNFFSRLKTVDYPYISVRKALLEDSMFEMVVDYKDESVLEIVDNIFVWAIDKRFEYVYNSNRYSVIMRILNDLPSEYSDMPFLRYTGKVAHAKEDLLPRPVFILERCQEGCNFLSSASWYALFENRLEKSRKLANFIRTNTVYVYDKNDLLYMQGHKDSPRWYIQTAVNQEDYPEHNDAVYDKWKTMATSNHITIHTSDKPISMNFNIMCSNSCIFTDKMQDNEFGFEVAKRVIVQQPNEDGLSLMKTIAKHIASMDFFKEPFIALQSLYVDELELLQNSKDGATEGKSRYTGTSNISLENCPLDEGQAQETLNNISQETANNLDKVNDLTKDMDGEQLAKLNEAKEPVKEIIDNLDKEDIERIAANKDKIMLMLDEVDEAEEEEKESQVRQTIGFIGELIYGHYLENKNKEFVHAALKGVGEYDFEVKTDNMYVDVKTTLYSLKDGTAPFYLHRSQNVFMQKHPNAKYHIVRISLIDLNLKKSYEELRDTYGKDANPLENEHLRKRCEQIAKRYWKAAKIEEFDALSPEYAIRIEKKS